MGWGFFSFMDAATINRWEGSPGRLRPALELASVVGLLEAELWFLRASGPVWLNVVVFGAIVAVLWLSHERRKSDGTAPIVRGFGRSWAEVLAVCAGLSVVLLVSARFVGDSSETFEFLFLSKPPLKLFNWVLGKFGAALGQQLALQLFLAPVCIEVTRGRASGVVLAASIFGLIHLPSPTLVAITTVGGAAWVVLYRRTGRLAPLVASHMVLATLAHGALPERLTFDMRVGQAATADGDRFATLSDPKVRRANRRLKENRASLIYLTSQAYFDAHGGDMPGFIRGLFRDVFGREAKDSDVAFWVNRKLDNPRVDIPSIFLASDEYAEILRGRRARAEAPAGVRR